MYLHVGNNKNIRRRDIICILDADNSTRSPLTKKFLSEYEHSGKLYMAVEEIPKSIVIYRTEKGARACFSQLSVSALMGRMEGKI